MNFYGIKVAIYNLSFSKYIYERKEILGSLKDFC